ncbi:putative N-acetylglucosamine kinase [Gaiella occulta]|uniref:Putative N-acetylglucosamine kinase n=1 Tax=Gaiella occulta TaxID=1002870 RepID=A0A7M2YX67_9ACTN|nr:BadF/BadG/BcrA/BcrD ATPase family protein [Gaiella occulta]RDI74722.1 putative N-acetylglucosamine kinase [Gaiella occulta]
MRGLALGVDGGNTKTVALAARSDGTIVGAGRAGCSDIYGAPSFEAAIREIELAVASALEAAGARRGDVDAAVFSLAGADWDEDKADLHAALARLVPSADVSVVNDALGALRAGTSDGIGVSVVCGTGGCVGARGPDGREWHSSWWALHTGGWALGSDALDAVYEAELGTGPPTGLTIDALEVFQAASVEDVLHAFTRRGGRRPFDAALFAPAVLSLAAAGDPVASSIVRRHGTKLGDVARVAAARVGLELSFPVVLLGGVLRGEGAETLIEEILARVPGATPVRSSREPVAGALLTALDRAGAPFRLDALDASLPGEAFFGTIPSH